MKMTNVKRAKMLAKEFLLAVQDVEDETAKNAPEWANKHPDHVETGAKSGLVRHWSVILSRQLAKMRREF